METVLLGENLYRHQDKLVDVYNLVRAKVNSLRRCMLGGSTLNAPLFVQLIMYVIALTLPPLAK